MAGSLIWCLAVDVRDGHTQLTAACFSMKVLKFRTDVELTAPLQLSDFPEAEPSAKDRRTVAAIAGFDWLGGLQRA